MLDDDFGESCERAGELIVFDLGEEFAFAKFVLAAVALAAAAAAYLLATVPLGLSNVEDLSFNLFEFVFALDNLSNTALALLKRDTRLAVLFRPTPRDGDVVPFNLDWLPPIGEPFCLSLLLCVPDIAEVGLLLLLLFSFSIDMA